MDYHNYKIHYVRDIHCLENVPVNLKIQNNIKNSKEVTDFLFFSFNFSNYSPTDNVNIELDKNENNQNLINENSKNSF